VRDLAEYDEFAGGRIDDGEEPSTSLERAPVTGPLANPTLFSYCDAHDMNLRLEPYGGGVTVTEGGRRRRQIALRRGFDRHTPSVRCGSWVRLLDHPLAGRWG